tara:strand:+ start:423 stop:989 length:567 start_codon:yes stop_codon:yes gene_type:complete
MDIQLTQEQKLEITMTTMQEVMDQLTKATQNNKVTREKIVGTTLQPDNPQFGFQWLFVEKVWSNEEPSNYKMYFSCRALWSEKTLLKTILFNTHAFIAQNMARELLGAEYKQFKKLLNCIKHGVEGNYVFAEVAPGASEKFPYNVKDFTRMTRTTPKDVHNVYQADTLANLDGQQVDMESLAERDDTA